MENKFTVGAVVSNHFGVLNRVSSLFSKRGYNIRSLSVGETENPELSRITIVVTGDDYVKEQVVKQLDKLQDVKKVIILDEENAVTREYMLIKLKAVNKTANKATKLINRFAGKIVDFSEETITVEITGEESQTEEFIKRAKDIGIVEVCRAGVVALSR